MTEKEMTAEKQFALLEQKLSPEEYNYRHFRTRHLLNDARRTAGSRGMIPGEVAPDFELPSTDGSQLRLSGLRGKPVLLTFSSYT